jgi:intein/homing endonuclease
VSGERAARIVKTHQMITWLERGRVAIPVPDPVAFNVSRGQVVEPYVLGLILGDGSITNRKAGIRLQTADEEIAEAFFRQFPFARRYHDKRANASWEMRALAGIDEIWAHFDRLRLAGCASYTKFIPRCYLMAETPRRWELFQGLMDTDGWAEEGRAVYYNTVSRQLAQDVMHLAHSLGAVCSLQKKKTSLTVRIKLRDSANAFRLKKNGMLRSVSSRSKCSDTLSASSQPGMGRLHAYKLTIRVHCSSRVILS